MKKVFPRKIARIRIAKRFPGFILALLLLSLLTYLLGWSTLFSAHSVAIDGTSRVDEVHNQIEQTQFHIGEPLARVDLRALNRKIGLLNWVEQVKVQRDWIHGRIHISVIERMPVAEFIGEKGNLELIDKYGRIFQGKGTANYPLISFRNRTNQTVDAVAAFVQELPSNLMENLAGISVGSADSISSQHNGIASGSLTIRWGSGDEMPTKIKVLKALLKLPENLQAKVIDLSSPLAPIVK